MVKKTNYKALTIEHISGLTNKELLKTFFTNQWYMGRHYQPDTSKWKSMMHKNKYYTNNKRIQREISKRGHKDWMALENSIKKDAL